MRGTRVRSSVSIVSGAGDGISVLDGARVRDIKGAIQYFFTQVVKQIKELSHSFHECYLEKNEDVTQQGILHWYCGILRKTEESSR